MSESEKHIPHCTYVIPQALQSVAVVDEHVKGEDHADLCVCALCVCCVRYVCVMRVCVVCVACVACVSVSMCYVSLCVDEHVEGEDHAHLPNQRSGVCVCVLCMCVCVVCMCVCVRVC